jgi:hypothetical protein
MNQRTFYSLLFLAGLVFIVSPEFLSAVQQTNDKFSGKEITDHANSISSFLFGPVARVAGVIGGGYGLVTSIITSSIRPLITFGGIGLGVNLVPKFIDTVFTMLLP